MTTLVLNYIWIIFCYHYLYLDYILLTDYLPVEKQMEYIAR